MFTKIKNIFKKKSEAPPVVERVIRVDRSSFDRKPTINVDVISQKVFQRPLPKSAVTGFAMDGIGGGSLSSGFLQLTIPEIQLEWFASQSFIGYQMAVMLSQNWLISKCCLMPARDAVRNDYDITVNDGTEVDAEILEQIRKLDVKYRINHNLVQFIQMGRIFGIRIAMFVVDSKDKEYYEKPFNIDGVLPGSYRGISQIDPYWMSALLDGVAAGDPTAIDFYEPTWWQISGKRIHKSHLVIFKTEEVPDILKPTYFYGGIPIPQKIYSRVYAAERIADEAPMLALTKRTVTVKTDVAQALADEVNFNEKAAAMSALQNNFATRYIGLDDELTQTDTSLADLDEVIMTQYQLVAAAANVPATKLLGTQPKGFNSTGEFEEASYHEELESIQAHGLTPLLDRHHLLLIRSEISPEFGISPFGVKVQWKPLDAMTTKEEAEINALKAQTGSTLMNSGAIDGEDERQRIINDPVSGYSGLEEKEILADPVDGD